MKALVNSSALLLLLLAPPPLDTAPYGIVIFCLQRHFCFPCGLWSGLLFTSLWLKQLHLHRLPFSRFYVYDFPSARRWKRTVGSECAYPLKSRPHLRVFQVSLCGSASLPPCSGSKRWGLWTVTAVWGVTCTLHRCE